MKRLNLWKRTLAGILSLLVVASCTPLTNVGGFLTRSDGIVAYAATEPTVLQAVKGASDGVVYNFQRVTTGFQKGEQYVFVPGKSPKQYLTVLPEGSGILKAEDKQSGGHFYMTSSVDCYVGVVRRTAGFDNCPHGTLNYGATEYNCWAGGVRHLSGGAYTDIEYSYGSKIAITVKRDNAVWDNADVALYQGSKKLKELTSGANGVYDFGYYANGTYTVYVNGERAEDVVVNAKPKQTDVGMPGEKSAEYGNFQYITDLTFGTTLEFTTLSAKTLLNGVESDAPGALMLQGNNTVYAIASGADLTVAGVNDKEYDITVGGYDTDHKVGKGKGTEPGDNNGIGDKDVISFYNMAVMLNSDTLMDNAEVTLRDADGEVLKILACSSTSGTTAVYSGIMQEEEDTQGVAAVDPTPYYVYVNGQYVYQTLYRVSSKNGVSGNPYEAEVTFYTAQVTMKKDDAAWENANLTIDNGRDHYTLTHTGSGVYKADVLQYLDGGSEKPYVLTVEGVIDSNENSLTKNDKTKVLDYYTVNYFTYKLAENGINYELKNDTPYRRQIVRSGCTTHAASDAYVQGLTFRWYSADQWDWVSGYAHSEYDYANTAITGTTNLYAQFAQPKVEVNEFVRTDENGEIKSNGTDFRIANATVSGYDVGENAIQSVHIAMKDVTSVKVLEIPEGCTVTPEGADALASGGSTSVKSMTVRFNEKVSMAAAQQWLRDNLVFTPVQPETNPLTCEVKITVSDSDITTAQSTENAQAQVAEATKLTGGTNVTLQSGTYYVDSDVIYDTNGAGQSALNIADGATVRIYVNAGATLTATGADASGTTGAGAGIYVPSNATLVFLGKGIVEAKGGNAADGATGNSNNKDAHVDHQATWSGTGGKGGDGGGGAGAGIGGKGGNGGSGGAGGGQVYSYNSSANGKAGSNGGAGSAGTTAGTVYIRGSVTVNATGGNAASGGSGGTRYTERSSNGGYNYSCNDNGSHEDDSYGAGAGGAGGGGGGGGSAEAIGGGGGGGAGGGGGGSAGTMHRTSGDHIDDPWVNAGGGGAGGAGGAGVTSGTTGANGGGGNYNYTHWGSHGGAGGNSGTAGSKGSDGTYVNPDTTGGNESTVTFNCEGINKQERHYSFGIDSTITVPDCENIAFGKYLVGWQVTNYGRNMNAGSEGYVATPLTTPDQTYYQPGEEISLPAGTYGDITMTAILRDKVGIMSMGKGSMLIPANFAETQTEYYTYTITTTLDGETADMGALTLTNGDEVHTLTADANGQYTMTISSDKEYTISSAKYGNNLGTVSKGETTALAFETMTVTVNGYDPAIVTVKNGEEAGPALTKNANSTSEKSVWKSVRQVAEDKGAYTVYVEGTEVPAYKGEAQSTAAYGTDNDVEVTYCTIKATVTGNETVSNVELRSGETVKQLPKLGGTANTWGVTFVKTDDETPYTLYVNGIEMTGKTADYADNHNLTAALYRLTVNTRIDGTAADVAGVTVGRKEAVRAEAGVFQLVTKDISDLAVKVGDTSVGSITDTTNYSLNADFYTIKFQNGTDEIEGKDNGIYYPGTAITVPDAAGAEPDGTTYTNANSYFNGWKIGDTVYKTGETFTIPSETATFTSDWALNSTAETRFTIAGVTRYGTLEEALEAVHATVDADNPGGVRTEFFIQNPVTLSENATIPANTKVTIEKPMHVYEDGSANETDSSGVGYIGQTKGGHLTIAEGVTLTNHGIISNDANLTIKNNAVLHNKPNGMFENKAQAPDKLTLIPATADKAAGKILNEGMLCNEGEADIPNGGIDNRGESENVGPGGQIPVSGTDAPNKPFGGMAEYDEETHTYKLTGNVTLEDTLEFASGEWTLDLNGYTLTAPSGKPAVKVTGASLIVTDSHTIADGDDNIDSSDPSRRAGKIQGGNGTPSDDDHDATQGSAGIEMTSGTVILNAPAAVYGGTGGLGINGKDGGAGGDGILHTGGMLMINNGALVQGGNGGNAMVQSDSTTQLGNGGTGGNALNTTKPSYVINYGSAAEAPETEGEIYRTNGTLKTPNITQRPGKSGAGYTHTVREIMDKGEPTITAPVAKNPIYTGREQKLIEAGSIEAGQGTLYYALSDSGTVIPVDGWTTDATVMSTADIGDYFVWYHSVGNADYYDSAYVAIPAPLLRKTPSITIAPTTSTLTYDGNAKTLATIRNKVGDNTYYFAVTASDAESAPDDDAAWSTTIPKQTDAGTYKIWYKAEQTDIYAAVEPTALATNVTINKATPSITITPKDNTYDNTEKALAEVSNTPDGVTFRYAVTSLDEDAPTDENDWSDTIPNKRDAGTYKIWYKAEGTDNYEEVTATAYPTNAMIKKAAVDYTAPELKATSMTYYSTPLELIKTAGAVTDATHPGTMYYAVTRTNTAPAANAENVWKTDISDIKATGAGTCYVWYKIDCDNDNNHGLDPVSLGSVRVSQYVAPVYKTSLTGATATFEEAEFDYTGKEITPVLTVKIGNKVLTEGTDYTVSGDVKATEPGEYTITINGKGNYEGTLTASWTIADNSEDIVKAAAGFTYAAPYVKIDNGDRIVAGVTASMTNAECTVLRTGVVYWNASETPAYELTLENVEAYANVKKLTETTSATKLGKLLDNGYGVTIRGYAVVSYKNREYVVYADETQYYRFEELARPIVEASTGFSFAAPTVKIDIGNRVVAGVTSKVSDKDCQIVKTGIVYWNASETPQYDLTLENVAAYADVKKMTEASGSSKNGKFLDNGYGVTIRGYAIVSYGGYEYTVYGDSEYYRFEELARPVVEAAKGFSFAAPTVKIDIGNRVVAGVTSKFTDANCQIVKTGIIYWNASAAPKYDLTLENVAAYADVKKMTEASGSTKSGKFLDNGYGVTIRGYAIVSYGGYEYTVYGDSAYYRFDEIAESYVKKATSFSYATATAKVDKGNRVVAGVTSKTSDANIQIVKTGIIYWNASKTPKYDLTLENVAAYADVKKMTEASGSTKSGKFLDNGYGVTVRGYAIVSYGGKEYTVYGNTMYYTFSSLNQNG